jgi:succinate dehydrogenase / fumarate reductase cytochrome b subunit
MSWQDSRPMSPHLQIYKLPLTALLSVLHRATGAALLGALFLLVICLLALASGETNWLIMHKLLSSWLGILILIGFTFSLYYHLCNGLRHMIWDLGLSMDKQSLKTTGFIVLLASSFLTLLTWVTPYLFSS